jgi:hypothetical protein
MDHCKPPNVLKGDKCICPDGPTLDNGTCDCEKNEKCKDMGKCTEGYIWTENGCEECEDGCKWCYDVGVGKCKICWEGFIEDMGECWFDFDGDWDDWVDWYGDDDDDDWDDGRDGGRDGGKKGGKGGKGSDSDDDEVCGKACYISIASVGGFIVLVAIIFAVAWYIKRRGTVNKSASDLELVKRNATFDEGASFSGPPIKP